VLQRPIETTTALPPFEHDAAFGSMGSNLTFAAFCTDGSNAGQNRLS